MDRIGYISKVEGNMAQVIVRRVSACGHNCASCGSSCSVPGITVNIENTVDAKEGDFVEIRLKTRTVLKSAFLVYIIPLILMVFGTGIGIYVFETMGFNNYETYGLLTGLAFLGISYIILRFIDRSLTRNNKLSFEMVRIVNSNE